MKTFTVKYRDGKTQITADADARRFLQSGISANMVEQVLEQIREKMRNTFGDYEWRLVGEAGKYAIRAFYDGFEKSFVESAGRTPQEAFFGCQAVRAVLY